jgi:hypothetical protein
MGDLQLHEGLGSFLFFDCEAAIQRTIRVFYSSPSSGVRDARVVVAMHGIDRAAEKFRDVLAGQARRNGQLVLVPEFDLRQFPDFYAYNFGGVRLPPPSHTVFSRDQWNFGIIDRLFRHVRQALGSNQTTFDLFGNSAGAQYVLRYLALTEGPAVDGAVAANSGMYMLPDLAADYPVGMGGLDLDQTHLRRYLGRRLVLLLGDADIDVSAPDLPRGDVAMAQGPHRLARGLWYFEHCSKLADRLGFELGWKLEVVPAAGHISQEIYDRASDILRDKSGWSKSISAMTGGI